MPYGAASQDESGQIYLDGVTKATASVRIAHESILAASLAVARQRMQGLAGGPSPSPKREDGPELNWSSLVEHCLLYTSPSPRDRQKSRMPSSA